MSTQTWRSAKFFKIRFGKVAPTSHAEIPQPYRSKIMAKKPEQTSKSVATKAATLLSNPKTPSNVKSVAASALTQAPNKKGKK
jgi:hypothetical protein